MSSTTGPAVGRITIADVARQAGVSVPTVSKVLNDRDDVAAETRVLVKGVLATSGYRPRRRQREPRATAPLVELVITDLTSAYAVEVLIGAESATSASGVGLVVTAAHDDVDARGWRRSLHAARAHGYVLVVPRLGRDAAAEVASLGAPVVLLDPAGTAEPSLPTVGATNFAGGVAATEHLLSLGHRRVATVAGPSYMLCSLERLEGFRAAMARAGVTVDETLVRHGDFSVESGQRAAAELLELPVPPTAVFAASDAMASGIYQETRRRGLDVPRDLSVVGFDDVSLCRYLSPPLTTVRQPLREMAAEAVRLVLEEVRAGESPSAAPSGREPRSPHLQMATHMVVRGSTAPLR